jgi:hypothetical protein
MMYLFGRNEPFVLQTLLTQRMGGGIGISYPFPRSSVAFSYGRVTVIGFVTFVFLLFMFLAEPPIC